MQSTPKYLHDKLVLLLVSSTVFLGFLAIILVLLSLGLGQSGTGYIVQYRSNLGISAFMRGGLVDMLNFVAIAIVVPVISIVLSKRTYRVRRLLSLMVLGSGILLLILAIIVSNALMVLR